MSSRPSTETSASCASTTVQRTDLLRADDDRPDRRQVGGDRRDDEVPADRVEDRAAGRERIAGRAGRAGDDEAVGDERGEVRVVDGDVEPADAGQRAAGDDDVVERDVAHVVDRLAVAQDPALERHPLVDREAAARRSWPRTASSSPASAFERKPTLPRLMPRIGTSTSATRADRAQERAVAAEHDERVGRRQLAERGLAGRPTGPASGRCSRIWHQPAARALSSTAASIVGL